MNRNSFQSSGVNLSQVNMNTQNINNLTRAITKLRNEISTSFIKLSDTPSFFGSAGQVVAVNSTRTGLVFVNQTTGGGGGGGGSTTLSGLTDTDTSASADNHLLQYNSTSQLWENVGDLTLPGTLTCPNAASFGSINGAAISIDGPAYFMSFQHDIQADVTFRGDTYIRKQGNNGNGDVGFYCNTQTNPPRCGIGTTQPDDTLTVKGIFGIRESFQAVPALFSQSTTGGGYVLVNTNTQTTGHSLTVNGQTALEGNLRLAGQLGVGATTDPGAAGDFLCSQGTNQTPTWKTLPIPFIDSWYLAQDVADPPASIINNPVGNNGYFVGTNALITDWQFRDSAAHPLGPPNNAPFVTSGPQTPIIVGSDHNGNVTGSFTQFPVKAIYRITYRFTVRFEKWGGRAVITINHASGNHTVIDLFEFISPPVNNPPAGLFHYEHGFGETYISLDDQDFIWLTIASDHPSTVLEGG